MNNILRYLISRAFLRQFSIALSIALFFLVFVFSCARVYTSHGKAYAVPDYTGIAIDDVNKDVERRHFRHEIFDSLYVATKDPGVVLDQHPKPGVLVKRNRKIYFTINASGPEKIPMPNFVGVTLREARARLVSSGLVMGKLSYRYDISKNVVLEQSVYGAKVEPGDSVAKGMAVDLVLGKGLGNERAVVPDLVGLTVDEAKEKVSMAMFNIGAVVPDGTVEQAGDTISIRVFRQRPASSKSTLIPLGSTITVWTTADSTKLPGYESSEEEDEVVWPELEDENE